MRKISLFIAVIIVTMTSFIGSLSATEHGVEGILNNNALLQAVIAGDPAAPNVLRSLFSEVNQDPAAIAALAVRLISRLISTLDGDPTMMTIAADMISDIASETLARQPIVRVSIGNNFSLPPGAIGWDLGSPDSPTYAGFIKLTQHDKKIVIGSTNGIERPDGNGLLSDGLINVRKIILDVDVPDGFYRLILMTDDLDDQRFSNPLGKVVTVNGVRSAFIANSSPDRWIGGGMFGDGAVGMDHYGATVIFVQVINGRLVIEFEAVEGSITLLTGFILEPADGPSALDVPEGLFFDNEEILLVESIISDVTSLMIDKLAQQADNANQRESIFNLDEPVVRTPESVSPN